MNREIEKQKYRALKSSTVIATTMIGLYSVFLMVLFIIESTAFREIFLYGFLFLLVIGFNIASVTQNWSLKGLGRLGIFNVLFIYAFITYLLFNENLQGLIANFFIAFTIGFIYLDIKIASLNHFLVIISSSIVMWVFPELLEMENLSVVEISLINTSIISIVIFLYLSAIFNIRNKNFNFEKLAKSKENEYRIINGLFEFQNEILNDSINLDVFYKDIQTFFETFTNKFEMENVFEKRLQLIYDLETLSLKEAKKKYKQISEEILEELKGLTINSNQKIRYLAYRISQANVSHSSINDPKDAFNSFRHYDDSERVKIMVFSAFYIYFRHTDADREALSHERFVELLQKSGLDQLVEPRILKSFYQYKDVIETIVSDAMHGVEVHL